MGEVSQVRIVSAIAGRVRLKVPRRGGMLEEMQRITDALTSRAGVSDVQVNPQTGSILVRYDPEHGSLDNLRSALQHLGIIINQETTSEMPPSSGGEASEASVNITRKLIELNTRVGRATNGLGDLRLFVPLGLGAITIRQIIRHGLKLNDLPWYVTGWYAYQSFINLNHETGQKNHSSDRSVVPPQDAVARAEK